MNTRYNPYPKYLVPNKRYAYSYLSSSTIILQLVKVTDKVYNLLVVRNAANKNAENKMFFKRHLYPAKTYISKHDELLFFLHNGNVSTFVELESETTVQEFARDLKMSNDSLEHGNSLEENVTIMNKIIVKLNHRNSTNFKVKAYIEDEGSSAKVQYCFDVKDSNTYLLFKYMNQ